MSRTQPEAPKVDAPLDDWLDYLGQVHVSAIDLGLERIGRVAQAMGIESNPQATVFTVAGTNGKGSTTKAISELCIAAGYKVGLYQSPHIYQFNERIQICAQPAADALIRQAIQAVDATRLSIGESLSFFEATTLAAFWVFQQQQCDVWVLEVGLGGRLDATNLIDADVAVVTSIALDHADWLGDDLEQIGREKAGVMRANRPVVLGLDVSASVSEHAQKLGCTIYQSGRDFTSAHLSEQGARRAESWVYSSPAVTLRLPLAQLAIHNVSLAITAVLASAVHLSAGELVSAMSNMKLAGRFEIQPMDGYTLLLDALHNPAGARFFLERYQEQFDLSAPICIVFSMLADKDILGVVSPIANLLPQAHWFVAPLTDSFTRPRAASSEQLKCVFEQISAQSEQPVNVGYYGHLTQAYAQAHKQVQSGGTLLVCGSFHTLLEAGRAHEK